MSLKLNWKVSYELRLSDQCWKSHFCWGCSCRYCNINFCMLGVLKRLLLGCHNMQFCYKLPVLFLQFGKCLTSFLAAVLKIPWLCIDWLAHISACFPTEARLTCLCVVLVSASVYVQFGTLPLCCMRPGRQPQGLWDIEDTRILWEQVSGYWRESDSSL